MSPLPTFFRLAHPDGPVLVRVVPRTSTSSRPLDLELRATDDVRAFVLPLQHSKISRYRREGTSLSEEEWESCLTSLLLGTGPIGHFDVTAKFTDENLGIEIGKRVSGATDIAGTLVLRPSKSATKNADMFAWASEAVLRQAQLAEELAELKLKHDSLQRRVDEETARFKALEHSKNEFESEHNSFFRDLLNEKKLKIRTQEQILSTAHVDEAKLAAIKAKTKATSGKSEVASRHPDAVGSSRKGKRKAGSPADDADGRDVDEMDVDEQSSSSGLSDDEQTTDEETASEPEPTPKYPTRPSGAKKAGGDRSPSASKPASKSKKPPSSNLRDNPPVVAADEDAEMPAARALPFGRKAKPIPHPADDDESTASES